MSEIKADLGCDCSWTMFTDAGVSTHSVNFHLDTLVRNLQLI